MECCRQQPRPRPAEEPKPRRRSTAPEKYEWELANGGTPFQLNGRELAALIAAAAGNPAPQRKGDRPSAPYGVEVTEKRRKQLVEMVKKAHVRSERDEKAKLLELNTRMGGRHSIVGRMSRKSDVKAAEQAAAIAAAATTGSVKEQQPGAGDGDDGEPATAVSG